MIILKGGVILGLCGLINCEFIMIFLGFCNNFKLFVEEKNKLIGCWKVIIILKKKVKYS